MGGCSSNAVLGDGGLNCVKISKSDARRFGVSSLVLVTSLDMCRSSCENAEKPPSRALRMNATDGSKAEFHLASLLRTLPMGVTSRVVRSGVSGEGERGSDDVSRGRGVSDR